MATRTEGPDGGCIGIPARVESVRADAAEVAVTLRLEGYVHPDDVGDMYRLMGRDLWVGLFWGDGLPTA